MFSALLHSCCLCDLQMVSSVPFSQSQTQILTEFVQLNSSDPVKTNCTDNQDTQPRISLFLFLVISLRLSEKRRWTLVQVVFKNEETNWYEAGNDLDSGTEKTLSLILKITPPACESVNEWTSNLNSLVTRYICPWSVWCLKTDRNYI
jgi:hypothetical protein